MSTIESNAEVYRAHADELTRYATAIVGPDHAPDVVTDAVLAAFESPKWRDLENQRAYLYRAVLNRANDHHRASVRRRRRERVGGLQIAQNVSMPEPAVDALDALKTLSARQRSIAYLAYWEDLTAEQIADRLDIAPGTVRKQLARARAQLRKVMRHD